MCDCNTSGVIFRFVFFIVFNNRVSSVLHLLLTV